MNQQNRYNQIESILLERVFEKVSKLTLQHFAGYLVGFDQNGLNTHWIYDYTAEEKGLLKEFVLGSDWQFESIEPDRIDILCQGLRAYRYTSGKVLLKAGQPSDGIYFILAGEMHVTRGDNKLIGKVTAGRSVGDPELNLVYTDSDQLVVAKDTHCFFLPRENYENLLAIRANAILNQRIDVLNSNFSVFQFWDNARLRSLAHIIKERRLLPNEVLFKDGFKNEYFYFLISGSVTVLKEIDFKEQNVWPTQAKSW